jgi:hypothetical protein
MSETMMRELLARLDAIGAKLGEGAAFTWETMMRQAIFVDGWLKLLISVGYALLAFVLYRTIRYIWSKKLDEKWNEERYVVEDEVARPLGTIFVGAAFVIVAWFSLSSAHQAISHIANPQYYALWNLARLVGR